MWPAGRAVPRSAIAFLLAIVETGLRVGYEVRRKKH